METAVFPDDWKYVLRSGYGEGHEQKEQKEKLLAPNTLHLVVFNGPPGGRTGNAELPGGQR